MINKLLWKMPEWLHCLICDLTGYLMVATLVDAQIIRERRACGMHEMDEGL